MNLWFGISIICCYLLFPSCSTYQFQKTKESMASHLYWSNKSNISIDDFQGKPSNEDKSMGEIYVQMAVNYQKYNLLLPTNIQIYCYMDRNISWINKKYLKTFQLKYFQTIFDINELNARKFRESLKLKENESIDPTNIINDKMPQYQDSTNFMVQKLREETKNGQIEKKVIQWYEKIRVELERYPEI